MKAVIIDDESKARHLLSTILTDYCPQITHIEEAASLMDGVQLIRTSKPNLVFLDIEMPDYLGIEIGDFLDAHEMTFHLIFTTAYSEYAIKAFEVNAVDYLLKPIRPKQIKNALNKIEQRSQYNTIAQQLTTLKESIQDNAFKKIAVPVSSGILFVDIEDIICMEADGMYTKLHTNSSGTQIISKPLKYFVEMLSHNEHFYRTHRSFLINIRFVRQYIKKDGHSILLEKNIETPLSRDKKEPFLEIINRMT
ncbi:MULTISPECIES: LytTR family DNA-binding domain-containing protein [unclassified Aureispira]|uniref:LytR/AlgR family response regulator transcription factor n=1 Tax=unclassified Aureispira TaxID=2649989 RepID=UPI00069616DE|nr:MULTISPECIES: LytTR family DNA-binding domain-containing protein [unclassified Aureispira]WMX12737.1 LytTR family DNA-binding domain-containing protein [Aureispira sp. CCB-E]